MVGTSANSYIKVELLEAKRRWKERLIFVRRSRDMRHSIIVQTFRKSVVSLNSSTCMSEDKIISLTILQECKESRRQFVLPPLRDKLVNVTIFHFQFSQEEYAHILAFLQTQLVKVRYL